MQQVSIPSLLWLFSELCLSLFLFPSHSVSFEWRARRPRIGLSRWKKLRKKGSFPFWQKILKKYKKIIIIKPQKREGSLIVFLELALVVHHGFHIHFFRRCQERNCWSCKQNNIYILFSFPILVFHLNMFLLDFVLISNEKHNITQICQMGILCFICFVSWEFSSANFIHFLVWLFFFSYSFCFIRGKVFGWHELGLHDRNNESFFFMILFFDFLRTTLELMVIISCWFSWIVVVCAGANSYWWSFWAAEMFKKWFDRRWRWEEAPNLWSKQAWGEKGE